MATHSQNIDNLKNAVYGEQVRNSMIQLFEEDYTLVKNGIGVGTAVSSASSPLGDYVDGNVYINSNTLDVFKCNGTAWVKVGNLKGIADITTVSSSVDDGLNQITFTLTDGTTKTFNVKNGSKGSTGDTGNGISSITTVESTADAGNNSVTIAMTDGTSKSFNVKNGSKGSTGDAAGFGTPTASVDRNTGTPSVTVTASGPDTAKVFNFDFKNIKGETGDKGDTGRSLTSITSIDSGKNHTLTATYSDGISNVITTLKDGNDGSGVGDMVKATYDTNDNGIVDKSEALFDSATGTTIPATTVLSKADKSTTLAGYGISDAYTKNQVNSKLDDKVNEPGTEGSAGQALITDGSGGRSWANPNFVKDIDDDEFDISDAGKLSLDTQIKNKLSNFDDTTNKLKDSALSDNANNNLSTVDESTDYLYVNNHIQFDDYGYGCVTFNHQGYITNNGSISSATYYANTKSFVLSKGTYTLSLSGSFRASETSTARSYVFIRKKSGDAYISIRYLTETDSIFTLTEDTEVYSGFIDYETNVMHNETIKVMLSKGGEVKSFEPCRKSNVELTEELSNLGKDIYTLTTTYGNIYFYKNANCVNVYGVLKELPSSSTEITLSTIPSNFSPYMDRYSYATLSVLSVTTPFTQIGTIFFKPTGIITLYKPLTETKAYISGCYATN